MLFGRTLEYWVLLLLPVLNYTADEVEFVYKQFYDVSARKKQTDPSNSRICNDNVTRKKTLKKKGVLLSFGRETKTENLCSNDTTIVLTCFMVSARRKTPVFSQSPFPTEIYGASNGRFWNTFDIRKKNISNQNSTLIFLPNKSQIKKGRLSNLNIKTYPPSQSVLGVKFPDGSRQDEPFFDWNKASSTLENSLEISEE